MKTLNNYTKVLLGYNDNQPIYLDTPSWSCGWYWSFGIIGNRNCSYHLDSLLKSDIEGLNEHFNGSFIVRPSDLWTFAELMKSFYHLRETAEVLNIGGSFLTSNPCKDIIINADEVIRINNVVLPSIIDEVYKILDRNQDNKKLFKKLVSINLKGDTQKVIEYMKKNSIKTDDLKTLVDNENYNHKYIEGLTGNDFNIIHSFYWKDYHANKQGKTIIK